MSPAALRAKLTCWLQPKSSIPSDTPVLGTNDFAADDNNMDRRDRSYRSLLMYAQPVDVAILVFSSFLALLAGGLNPILTIIYSHFVGSFQEFAHNDITGEELSGQVGRWSLYYVYLAIAEFVLIYMATVGFYIAGERISRMFRTTYLRSIIQQEMAFFDEFGVGELTERITTDINRIQEALSSKLAVAFTAAATFSVSLAIALSSYWSLAFIVVAGIAVIGVAEALGGRFAIRFQGQALRYYSNGSATVQEAIGSIRHVYAFGLQDAMAQRYENQLHQAEAAGLKARFAVALMISVMNSAPYFIYGTAFWQGVRFVVAGELTATKVVQIAMATVTGAFSVGRVAPALESFVASIASARPLIETIAARPHSCDPFSTDGDTISGIQGALSLQNMSLVYPSRPNVTVLKNINCDFPVYCTTAVVGESGCGKSSIVSLIERFYTPSEGQIFLDGHDIQKLNLHWLRRQIAIVSQEPVLFNTTIFENIQHGLHTNGLSDVDLKDRVTAAAKMANAHVFIMALPKGYQTVVGGKGMQLSGGQRQRISLARALISEAQILILDEASSALDAVSERMVHAELESTSHLRTTIVITHRLSTIRTADKIIVLEKGSVAEQGNHQDLMALNGVYARLVKRQMRSDSDSLDLDDSDLDDDNRPESRARTYELTHRLWDEAMDVKLPTEQESLLGTSTTDEKNEAQHPSFYTYLRILYRFNRSERVLIFIGIIMCAFCGLVWPINSVILGKEINALSFVRPSHLLVLQLSPVIHRLDQDYVRQVDFWAVISAALGVSAWLVWLFQGTCFAVSSEKLVVRAKYQVFQAVLRQDMQFFDEKAHSPGALASLVSTSTNDLAGVSGPVLGSILTCITTIVVGIVISMIAGWKLALVCTSAVPIVVACGWLRLRILVIFDRQIRKTNEDAAAYASEMVSAIRTVASLCLEQHVLDEYQRLLEQQASQSVKTILQASIFYGFSHSLHFLAAALAFWYGGKMIVEEGYSITSVFVCFTALVSGAQIAGAVFTFAPDASKAMHASQELKSLLDRRPQIEGKCPDAQPPAEIEGRIHFESVSFCYPTRPEHSVLNAFNLSIEPGQYIAFVGPSGGGKSTLIALLERFFDPAHGRILVDGQDISALDVYKYRQQLSLVSQEPILFQGTIRENLLLGAAKDVSDEDVLRTCKEANLGDFLSSLPDGLDTYIGPSGTMLSGGQKQRVAIARALLRRTKILLLDEATSALDSESERLVQEALDRAAKNRTTIAIAHRLSTIWDADLICVLDKGRIIELGNHGELMARKGLYYTMFQLQTRENSYTG